MNAMEQKNKMVIYQVFPRWFGNLRPSPAVSYTHLTLPTIA